MKRESFEIQKRKVSSSKPPKKKRHISIDLRPGYAAKICRADREGPRIPTILREFEEDCKVPTHLDWISYLEKACEKLGCYISDCNPGAHFATTHGAKSLLNSIVIFLAYYVPRKFILSSDDEWREILAAIRSFHSFCVRRKYAKEDAVLMTALHKLRRFHICGMPEEIERLVKCRYWDQFEERMENELTDVEDNDECTNNQYESYVGDLSPLVVEQVLSGGWILRPEEYDDETGEAMTKSIFLQLPASVSTMGMQGTTLTCMTLALRNRVWRPILCGENVKVGFAFPPDDVFYY